MFGHRNDAVSVAKDLDPIILFTPLIMPTRNESMIQVTYPVDYEPLANYIRKNNGTDHPVSFLSIIAAAYVRTVAHHPVFNYFISGKHIYRHKDISISLIVLKDTDDGSFKEAEVKIHCGETDTVFDIARMFDREIAQAKKADTGNGTSDFAGKLLRIPALPSLAVAVLLWMERRGILPKKIIDISPFHCSLFLTNMMSIGMPSIYHHLYNIGTCSIFMSVGRPERQVVTSGGQVGRKMMLPLGFSTDERICGGAEYALGIRRMTRYLQNPELLELSLEEEKALDQKK